MTETQEQLPTGSALTAEQRTDILRHMRAGISIPAAAADVGVEVSVALSDAELRQKSPEAYAVGSARLEKFAMEFAIAKGDPGALMRFLERRDAATQEALASLQERQGSSVGDWLISHGLTPPEGRNAVEYFVDLFRLARKLLRQAGDPAALPPLVLQKRARRILRRAGYDVVAQDARQEYAEEVLAAVYDNRIDEFERE